MRVVVFYHRSVGERCSSIRYRLQTRQDGLAESYASDDAPAGTTAATRSRKSPEYGAGTSFPNDMLRHDLRRLAVACKTLF
jgi:hypothetical protein